MNELPKIPRADEIEAEILGVLFVAPERFDEVAEKLKPSDFYGVRGKIFGAMLRLEAEHRPIELFLVAEVLADDPEFQGAGGSRYLAELGRGCYGRAPLAEYCRTVKTAAKRRDLQRLLNSASQQIASRDLATEEILESLELNLSTLQDGAARSAIHIGEAARQEIGPILERVGSGKGAMLGVPTGFPDLDRLTAGLGSGDMFVLASRPSGGKTSFGLESAIRQAREGNAVAVFSLEMNRAAVILRMVCRDAGVSFNRVQTGFLRDGDLRSLVSALARVSLLPIWIDDSAALSAYELRSRLRSLAERHKIRFAIVDYLQLLRAKAENRTQEITKISIELKAAAKELGQASGGTLLVISQLNRAAADARPQLHHLRESGQIEQDADTVLFLFDPELAEHGEPNPGAKILAVAKNRNGPLGDVRLVFLPQVMGFEPAFPEGWAPDAKTAAVAESR